MFNIFKKKPPKLVGDLYVSQNGEGNPELFGDFYGDALAGIANEKYVTMRVIVVKPGNPQK